MQLLSALYALAQVMKYSAVGLAAPSSKRITFAPKIAWVSLLVYRGDMGISQ